MTASKLYTIIFMVLLIAAVFAWGGSQGSVTVAGLPLFALCAALVFIIQWLVFLPSWMARSEQVFDLTGSLTYITVTVLALIVAGATDDPRSLLLTVLVCLWAVRLGSFLFLRVRQQGSDGRFDRIKHSFSHFLLTWTLQGLWVLLTLSAALAAISAEVRTAPGLQLWAGLALWTCGFLFEVVADTQKQRFRAAPETAGRFITTGLWAWSRHPNYFGEILLWIGIAVIAQPVLAGWQAITLISPLFVYLLITRVSGIPLLEARAEKRWGDDPAYQQWKKQTPRLFPRPPRQ